eukprot:PhF_6_TR12966/c0_g1_i1/m.20488
MANNSHHSKDKNWLGSRSQRRMTNHFFSLGVKVNPSEQNLGPGAYGVPQPIGSQTARTTVIHAPAPPPLSVRAFNEKNIFLHHQSNDAVTIGGGGGGGFLSPTASSPRRLMMAGAASTERKDWRSKSPPKSNMDQSNGGEKIGPEVPLVHTTGGLYNPYLTTLYTPAPDRYNPVLPSKGPVGVTRFSIGSRGMEKRSSNGEMLFPQTKVPGPGTYFPRLDKVGFAGRDRYWRKKYRIPRLPLSAMDLASNMGNAQPISLSQRLGTTVGSNNPYHDLDQTEG